MNQRIFAACSAAALVFGVSGVTASPSTVNTAVKAQVQAERNARSAQRQIDRLDDQTKDAIAEYRAVIAESESLKRYIGQLIGQVRSQDDEIESLKQQLQEIENTNREVLPMMDRMVGTLGKFIDADVPFLPEERADRQGDLETLMLRADITTAEKYRRILESYQTEMEYGRNIEAYTGDLGDTGREVEFLRVGRVALMYQTRDGNETGYWDNDKRDWVLAPDLERSVAEGLRIARKQAPPNLMILPIHAPQEVN